MSNSLALRTPANVGLRAGDHQVVAAGDLLVVDRGGRAVVLDDALRAPQLDRRLAERAQESGRAERTARRRTGIRAVERHDVADRPQIALALTLALRHAVDQAGARRRHRDALRLGEPGDAVAGLLAPHLDAPGGAILQPRVRLAGPGAGLRQHLDAGPRQDLGRRPGRERRFGRAAVDDQPAAQDQDRQHEAEQHQERALDELHPGRRHHAGGDDDGGDDDADQQHADDVRQAEQRRDQRAGADHLRNQVEEADDQRADGGRQLDAARVVAAVEGVGEGEAPHPLQRLGDDEERDDPAGEVADRIQEAVVAVEGDHPADAEERRRGQVVAGEGDAVDEPVNFAVRGVVAGRRRGAAAEPRREADDDEDEGDEDADGERGRRVDHRPAFAAGAPGAASARLSRHSHQ